MSLFDFFPNSTQDGSTAGSEEDAELLKAETTSIEVDFDAKTDMGSRVIPYVKAIFEQKIEELKRVAISVPRIGMIYSSEISFKPVTVKRNVVDFEICLNRNYLFNLASFIL